MKKQHIDIDLTLHILKTSNTGLGNQDVMKILEIPSEDENIVPDPAAARAHDGSTGTKNSGTGEQIALTLPAEEREAAIGRLLALLPESVNMKEIEARHFDRGAGRFTVDDLERLGILCYPRVSCGILNGGSATSYADHKKNRALDSELFDALHHEFEDFASLCREKPKGITPAFANSDGTYGYSFLEMHLRALLIDAQRSIRAIPGGSTRNLPPLFPTFQMTSTFTNGAISDAMEQYADSPAIAPLLAALEPHISRSAVLQPLTGIQPLIAAYTHSSEGPAKQIFDHAWDIPNNPLPLPGGHGQNFFALRGIYRQLYAMGKRYVYLCNVDNLGALPNPAALAYLILKGRNALFEFSYRTPIDVKGGILVRGADGKLVCGDLGSAIDFDEAFAAEKNGRPLLFNCAIGLFDLEALIEKLDTIIATLPIRFSDQNKEAGCYSQAEQITWEVMSYFPDSIIFCVNKQDRFLAAKLLLETLLTSGRIPPDLQLTNTALGETAQRLQTGLRTIFRERYGLQDNGGCWTLNDRSGSA